MDPLSKTIKLGVIILALGWLGKQGFSLPRIVAPVALLLGISRKSGYQAAGRIVQILRRAEEKTEARTDFGRENSLLRIQLQVVTFERDHPGVRFSDRHRHLPREGKSLCVRIYRDFQGDLSESEIASVMGVPLSSLRRWESEADEHSRFPSKPERRGSHLHATAEDARGVVEEFQRLQKPMTLEEFTEHYNQKHTERTLDRRTITRILQAEGHQKLELPRQLPR
jgi:transposase